LDPRERNTGVATLQEISVDTLTIVTARGYEKGEVDARNDAEALRLRTLGLTYREIAGRLGVNVATAQRRCKRALTAVPVEAVAEHRSIELSKLDRLEQICREILAADHPRITANGRVVLHEGLSVHDYKPVLKAIAVLLSISDRRCKLLGLDAPVKTALTYREDIDVDASLERSWENLQAILSNERARGDT
jgi:predicted DNA-binding protein (UPF0251 family)